MIGVAGNRRTGNGEGGVVGIGVGRSAATAATGPGRGEGTDSGLPWLATGSAAESATAAAAAPVAAEVLGGTTGASETLRRLSTAPASVTAVVTWGGEPGISRPQPARGRWPRCVHPTGVTAGTAGPVAISATTAAAAGHEEKNLTGRIHRGDLRGAATPAAAITAQASRPAGSAGLVTSATT